MRTIDKAGFIKGLESLFGLCTQHGGKTFPLKSPQVGRKALVKLSETTTVRIDVCKMYSSRFVRYDMKPSEMTPSHLEQLATCTEIFGNASYRKVLVSGRVTYLEIAVDSG